jgi:hypothetical protein
MILPRPTLSIRQSVHFVFEDTQNWTMDFLPVDDEQADNNMVVINDVALEQKKPQKKDQSGLS